MLLTAETLAHLRQGAILLTANQQLATRLRLDFQQQSDLSQVWPTPSIFHLEDWLRESFFRLQEWLPVPAFAPPPASKKRGRPKKPSGEQLPLPFSQKATFLTLLTPAQSLALWTQHIEKWKNDCLPTDSELALLQVKSTAAAAYQTYRFCCQEELTWETVQNDPKHFNAPDHLKFLQWWQSVRRSLDENAWLDAAALPNFLQTADWSALWPKKNQTLIFYDFDIIPKNLENLQNVLRKSGYQLLTAKSPSIGSCQFFLATAPDPEAEWQQAALWVKQQLQDGKKNLGIISRDVAALRPRLTPYLLAALQPAALANVGESAQVFRFNIGLPLTDFPIVAAGLNAWDLLAPADSLPLPALGDYLRAPFFPWWPEQLLLEKYRRQLYDAQSPEVLINHLQPPQEVVIFQEKWQIFLEKKAQLPKQARWSIWLKQLRDFWQAIGFGQGRALSSAEFQCHTRLMAALEEQVALEQIWQEALTFAGFQEKLRSELQDILFQPQGRSEAPVQILGVLEAESQRFDALWLLDAQARHWPAAARPLPFLRQELQLNRPESTAHGQQAKAERLLKALLHAAPLGVISVALHNSEGQVQAPSPLLPSLLPLPPLPTWQHPWLQSPPLLPFIERSAATAKKITATILEHQSSCPFRGYVSAQLPNLRPFPELLPFLSKSTRGTLLHEILREFFEKHPQAADIAADAAALHVTLPKIIEAVFSKAREKYPQALAEPYFSVEKQSAWQLLRAFLLAPLPEELPGLRVVLREYSHTVSLAGLTITGRLDRLDVFVIPEQSTTYVLWDYKTGSQVALENDLKTHEEDGSPLRLKKPQLPFYALNSVKTPVSHVGYIHLHPNVLLQEKVKFYHLNAVTTEKAQAWQVAINTFVQAIQAGDVSIQPQKEACTYCQYSALCRHPDLEKSAW
jgi:probable DNA repair protein